MIGYFNDSKKKQLLGVWSVMKAEDGNIYKRELKVDELDLIGKWEKYKKIRSMSKEINQTVAIAVLYDFVKQLYAALPKTVKDNINVQEAKKVYDKLLPIYEEYKNL